MTAQVDHLSWWCDHEMNWQEFHDAVEAHIPIWRQRKAHLDHVGYALLRDSWEPRRDPTPRRKVD